MDTRGVSNQESCHAGEPSTRPLAPTTGSQAVGSTLSVPSTASSSHHPHRAGLQSQDLSSIYLAPSASEFVVTSSRASPDPPHDETDPHGGIHEKDWNDLASGVSFLRRVDKRLRQSITSSQPSTIFNFGDAPQQIPGVDFSPSCMMPPREVAQRLFTQYFEFATPTYRFLHRGTMQKWLDDIYHPTEISTMHRTQGYGAGMGTSHSVVKIAMLFMIFALATVYMPEELRFGPPDMRLVFRPLCEYFGQIGRRRNSD